MPKDINWIVKHLNQYGNCSISRKQLIRGRDVELLNKLTESGLHCKIICIDRCTRKKTKEDYPDGQGYVLQVISK